MNNTKHDLSANIAKLNLDEMISAAYAGVFACKTAVERGLSTLQNEAFHTKEEKDRIRIMNNNANYLAEDAARLAKTTNLLHFLFECKTREEIEIVKE